MLPPATQSIVVFGEDGSRSSLAAAELRGRSFTNVFDGGSWRSVSLALGIKLPATAAPCSPCQAVAQAAAAAAAAARMPAATGQSAGGDGDGDADSLLRMRTTSVQSASQLTQWLTALGLGAYAMALLEQVRRAPRRLPAQPQRRSVPHLARQVCDVARSQHSSVAPV